MKDGAYEIARNHGNDGYHRTLASMIYKFVDKKKRIKSNSDSQSGNTYKWTPRWKIT